MNGAPREGIFRPEHESSDDAWRYERRIESAANPGPHERKMIEHVRDEAGVERMRTLTLESMDAVMQLPITQENPTLRPLLIEARAKLSLLLDEAVAAMQEHGASPTTRDKQLLMGIDELHPVVNSLESQALSFSGKPGDAAHIHYVEVAGRRLYAGTSELAEYLSTTLTSYLKDRLLPLIDEIREGLNRNIEP